MADTRKDRRAPVSLKVRFKSATVDEFIEHYCKDVSRGGIFIKSSQPMAIGTLLKFQFQLKDESSLIKGVGRVVWTRSPEDAVADQPAGMGIKFIKMDNESRAIVDRIVESHGMDGGAFDEGRATATQAENPSERPAAGGGTDSFFPEVEPAELPPPEDRTAVRQAAQFLAAALAEGGTDKAAAREAEQKAEEARQRTAQIEAQRLAVQQGKPAPAASSSSSPALPSMIVDPSLGAKEGAPVAAPPRAEDAGPITTVPPPLTEEIPTRPGASLPPPSVGPSSLPPAPPLGTSASAEPGSKKSKLIPAAILVGILAVAAWVYQRRPSEVEPTLTPAEPAKIEPAAQAPEPAPPPAVVPPTEPAPEVVEAAPDAAVAEPAPEQKLVEVDIKSVPPDAELLVGGVVQGKAPLKLPLPEGVVSVVTARAPGYRESSQEIDPGATPKKALRFTLLALPHVLRVETTPPGAKISVGAKRGDAGQEIDLGPIKGQLAITARLPGYEVARAPLKLEDFTQTADNMHATVSLSLSPLPVPTTPPPAPKPAVRVRPAPVDAAAPSGGVPPADTTAPSPAPSVEPAAAPAPDKPVAPAADKAPEPPVAAPAEKPAPPPAEKAPAAAPEKLPENPFNQ
ncbi:MAG TPA: TIGR02266 family protein [Polyangiales bacterium]